MEVNWADVPPEILAKVMEQLKYWPKTLFIQLQLTCKNWRPVAQDAMYEVVRLPSKKVSLLIETLQIPGKNFASKVIEIQFSNNSQPDSNFNLIQIIRLCPNVKYVGPEDGPFRVIRDDYYSLLLELYKQGYLRALEKIYTPDPNAQDLPDDTIKDYTQLTLALKGPVKRLYTFINRPTISVSLIPVLREFESLEEICIDASRAGISFTYIREILQCGCPFLKKATIIADNLIADASINTPGMTPLSQIKVLKVRSTTCSAIDMKLIQQMFPSLDGVYISTLQGPISFNSVGNMDSTIAKGKIKDLFGYLSKRKAFDLDILRLETSSLTSVLCIASKQLRIHSVSITIEDSSWGLPSQHSLFKIRTRIHNIFDEQTAHAIKEGECICYIRISVDQVSANLWQLLLKVLAEHVNPYSIEISDDVGKSSCSRRHSNDTYKEVLRTQIDCMLKQFKNLKTLKLSRMPLAMETSADRSSMKLQLDKMEILDCEIPALFFEKLSRQITYIKTLTVDSTRLESTSISDLSMPYTEIECLCLRLNNLTSYKLSIMLNAAIVRMCFDAYGNPRQPFYEDDGDVPMFSIRCVALSELDIASHQLILKPKYGFMNIFERIKPTFF